MRDLTNLERTARVALAQGRIIADRCVVRDLTKGKALDTELMTGTVASSTTRVFGEPLENSEGPITRVYRLRKSFATVHFESAGKGRIVFLPEGAEVHVIGPSGVCECFEVMFETQLYNMFKVDLLGPWSNPIKSHSLKPIGTSAAMRACA